MARYQSGHGRRPAGRANQIVTVLLKRLVSADGDYARIHAGLAPAIVKDDEEMLLPDEPMTADGVRQIVDYLLPEEYVDALSDIGQTRYHLPRRQTPSREDLVALVTDDEGGFDIEIHRFRPGDADAVPEELFTGANADEDESAE